jgi:hypothetical protein
MAPWRSISVTRRTAPRGWTGTAEGEAVPRKDVDAMVDLGLRGVEQLVKVQNDVLDASGVDRSSLFI